jgi:hypothetical protein
LLLKHVASRVSDDVARFNEGRGVKVPGREG